jgi:hypothetical protein
VSHHVVALLDEDRGALGRQRLALAAHEIGLLAGVPRTASVTAETDGLLSAMDGDVFLELVGGGPGRTSRLLDFHRGAWHPGER